jgi:hypothetical protein
MGRRTEGQPPEYEHVGTPPKIKKPRGKGHAWTNAVDEGTLGEPGKGTLPQLAGKKTDMRAEDKDDGDKDEDVVPGPGIRNQRILRGRKADVIPKDEEEEEDDMDLDMPPPRQPIGEKLKGKRRAQAPSGEQKRRKRNQRGKDTRDERKSDDEDEDVEKVRQGIAEAKLDDDTMVDMESDKKSDLAHVLSPRTWLKQLTEDIRKIPESLASMNEKIEDLAKSLKLAPEKEIFDRMEQELSKNLDLLAWGNANTHPPGPRTIRVNVEELAELDDAILRTCQWSSRWKVMHLHRALLELKKAYVAVESARCFAEAELRIADTFQLNKVNPRV